jgi:hypothetical protein
MNQTSLCSAKDTSYRANGGLFTNLKVTRTA